MIKFETLTLKNFMSYGADTTTITLDRPGTTLVTGEDLDNTGSGVGANGCGKTTLMNGLVYALYDKPISNISKDNLVNNTNKKNMIVTLTFSHGDDRYEIQRARKTKAGASGNWVTLTHNDMDITPDSINNTNDLIAEIIGMPYDLFVRVCAISATHVPFFDLPARSANGANQTDIIEQLFDLKSLTAKADLLKIEIKDTERSTELHKVKHDSLIREHDRHEKMVTSANTKVALWQKQNDDKIVSVSKKLEALGDIDVEGQKQAVEAYSVLEAEMETMQSEYTAISTELRALKTKLSEVTREMSHLKDGECPYCNQEYSKSKTKFTELSVIQESIADEITNIDIDSKSAEVTSLSKKVAEAADKIEVVNLDELYDIKGKVSAYTKQLEELQAANNPMQSIVDELEGEVLDSIDPTTINDLTVLGTHQKFLLKLLTRKDSFVRKALLNKNIPFINQRLAQYLKEIGLRHTVEFTHEMTASITQFGRVLDFGNLSSGQQARVNLALSFAFRDVLQSMHVPINVCMLDEVLDVGLDMVGVQSASKMISDKARLEGTSMFIVSPKDETYSVFDHKLKVQMHKGFSGIAE